MFSYHIYFTLVGNKVEAYGGTISFTLGHSEYNSLGLGEQVNLSLHKWFFFDFQFYDRKSSTLSLSLKCTIFLWDTSILFRVRGFFRPR